MTKKKNISEAISSIPRNVFSGLVVSFIALPLSLGLAMASDAPPISGVIASIVGGVVVSILGGTYVTISGPGKGLVAVILVSISSMGLSATYAAIICSGIILLLLGFLRLGKLADYFPSSAIQGVLAAIGLIILGKQFHIMLGNKIFKDNTIGYLAAIPETIQSVFFYENQGLQSAAIAGSVSLLIMVVYSKIRNKYLRLVPAPMWIVVLSLTFSYYCEFITKTPNPISEKYMVPMIPGFDEIISSLPTPDFSIMTTVVFWSNVTALTLIASIESLLSIKAVDKLDLRKRRSNVNKEIKALGLSTALSGLFGGLSVVSVIAPSSVNINNGGSVRLSNFCHSLFLSIFILLLSTELARIPLPALMAILVYTGYKLASPTLVKKIFFIGKEQLIIFFATLLITLKVGLISGIFAGIVITFFIHVLINKSFNLFFKNILKPNVLMFKESDSNYFISVKHFCSFLNFNNLKNKLDVIPQENDVVVDFSLCTFVDHTALENIDSYQELFYKKGGNLEVIGLDMLGTRSEHPFALRRVLPLSGLINRGVTKRENSLKTMAEELGVSYSAKKQQKSKHLRSFRFFSLKRIKHITNVLINKKEAVSLFDIRFSQGESITEGEVSTTMLLVELTKKTPSFTLTKEGLLERFYAIAVDKDIDIEGHKRFSSRFYLTGKNEKKIKLFFSKNIIKFLDENPSYYIESSNNSLLIFSKERLASVKEAKSLLEFGLNFKKVILEA